MVWYQSQVSNLIFSLIFDFSGWANLAPLGRGVIFNFERNYDSTEGGGQICPTRSKFFLISIANFSIFQKFDVFLVESDGLEYSYDMSIVKIVKKPL